MWKINNDRFEFFINDLYVYSIDAEDYLKNEKRWIEHLSTKRWFSHKEKSNLFRLVFTYKNKLKINS